MGADQVCPLTDSQQAKMPQGGKVGGAHRHVKAGAVIHCFQFDPCLLKGDQQVRLGGPGVFDDIVECLLCDAIERQLDFA
jgi:hypothetical protein